MATSKERNLKLVITGDTKDVEKKIAVVKTRAERMGVSLASTMTSLTEKGTRANAVLTFMAANLKKLEQFEAGTKRATGKKGENGKVIFTDNEEEQLRVKKKNIAEKKRLEKQAATERLRLAKETNSEITRITRDAAASQKTIAINGINSRLGIKARAAAQEKAIFRNLQAELKAIAKRTQAGSLVGNAATVARTKAQAKAQRALNVVYADTGKRLDALPAKISKNNAGHKTWARHVTEIVGLYRLVNFGINTVIESIKAIPRVGIDLQTTEAVFESTLGSSAATAGAFKALDIEAQRTGIAVGVLRENFRNLNASMSLAGERTETVFKVFTDLNTVSTALHLSSEKTKDVFLAISQIFNKTKVQSEELVKQLGNLLPGAFASFATATGRSTKELADQMKKGLVTAHDDIVAFTDFMAKRFAAGFAIAEIGLQANIGRMQTSFTHLGEAIFRITKGPMIDFTKAVTVMVDNLTEGLAVLKEFANYITTVVVFAITRLAVVLGTTLVTAVTAAGGAMTVFAGTMAFLTAPATLLAGIAAVAFAISRIGKESKDAVADLQTIIAEVNKPFEKVKIDPIEIRIDQTKAIQAIDEVLEGTGRAVIKAERNLTRLQNEGRNFRSEKSIQAAKKEINRLNTIFANGIATKEKLRDIERSKIKIEEKRQNEGEAGLFDPATDSTKGIEAKRKAELAYQKLLDQTRLKLLTIRGEDEKAAKFKLAITQRQGLAQLTGLDAVTANLREQVLETQHLAEAELERTFQAARLGEEKAKLAVQESLIKAELAAGILTELQAYKLVKASKEEAIRLEEELLNKQITAAGENPTANLEAGFDRTTQKIQLMKAELLGLKAPLSKVEQMGLSLKGSLESSLGNAFEGFITGAKSAGDAMADFATSILKAVARLAAQELAVKLIGMAIGAFSSGAGASASGGTTGSFSASDLGGSLDTTSLTTFAANGLAASGLSGASGTVLSSPTYFPNAKVTPFASGGVLAGEAGPEAVLPLERNSQGKLGVKADLGDVGASSGVVIQQLTVNLTEKEDESSEEQSQRIGKAIKQQLNSLIDNKLALSKRPGAIMNPTQLQATF